MGINSGGSISTPFSNYRLRIRVNYQPIEIAIDSVEGFENVIIKADMKINFISFLPETKCCR